MKACSKCQKSFPVRSYHRQGEGKRSAKCKECRLAEQREYRKTAKGRAVIAANNRSSITRKNGWRKNNNMATNAQNRVAKALKNGVLVKRECEVCGQGRSVAHHNDYSKPLEVQWLCDLHHKNLHKTLTRKGEKYV